MNNREPTGLADKNGFPIWTGDVVKGDNRAHEAKLMVGRLGASFVLWSIDAIGRVSFSNKPYCTLNSRAICSDFSSRETDLEIIGSINNNFGLINLDLFDARTLKGFW